jgi:hypothetical protein
VEKGVFTVTLTVRAFVVASTRTTRVVSPVPEPPRAKSPLTSSRRRPSTSTGGSLLESGAVMAIGTLPSGRGPTTLWDALRIVRE